MTVVCDITFIASNHMARTICSEPERSHLLRRKIKVFAGECQYSVQLNQEIMLIDMHSACAMVIEKCLYFVHAR